MSPWDFSQTLVAGPCKVLDCTDQGSCAEAPVGHEGKVALGRGTRAQLGEGRKKSTLRADPPLWVAISSTPNTFRCRLHVASVFSVTEDWGWFAHFS